MTTKRGTSRRAIGVKKEVHGRLKAHVDALSKEVTCSSYVEETLRLAHPEVFGDEAPPPPKQTPAELEATKKRQQEARARVDQERFEQVASQGPTDPKPSEPPKPEPKTVKKQRPGQPPLTPAEPVKEKDPSDDEFPPSIIMF